MSLENTFHIPGHLEDISIHLYAVPLFLPTALPVHDCTLLNQQVQINMTPLKAAMMELSNESFRLICQPSENNYASLIYI